MRQLRFEVLERREMLSGIESDLFVDAGANLSHSESLRC